MSTDSSRRSILDLNFHHLRYFWVVAREGGLANAGRALRVSHPTLHAQVRALEAQLGERLLTRAGRKLVPTDTGQVALRYAEEIFRLGRELVDAVQGRSAGQPIRLAVGATDVVPKLVVRRLLQPALALAEPVRLVVREGPVDALVGALAQHRLDLVIAESTVPPGSPVRAYNHFLGETGVSFFATPQLAASLRGGFPACLHGAPTLLPVEESTLRRSLDPWLSRQGVSPRPVAEFEDSALLKVFGADGVGVFPAPTAVERDVVSQYGVVVVGRTDEVRERFYALSVERTLKHPAVVAISHGARHELFRGGSLGGATA